MAQNVRVEIPVGHYTRADFTALRAHLNRIPVDRIADLYYTEDDRDLLRLHDAAALRRRLDDLRDELVQRATDTNPYLAAALHDARRSTRWSKAAIDHLVHAADKQATAPRRGDPVSMWFQARVARPLKHEGAHTVADLVDLINRRGNVWWRPIPRIGEGKAATIIAWLQKHAATVGHLEPSALLPAADSACTDIVVLSPDAPVLVPFERIGLPEALSGAHGINRSSLFCLIYARNDREAIEAYLYKYRGQDKTQRAYRKELERYLLWCVLERRRPMSSTLLEDCEAYKDFIQAPPEHWVGPRAARFTPKWRPFVGAPSPTSQRYAIQTIRTFFRWLVELRYLGGNPWAAISDPDYDKPEIPIQIRKALPSSLWDKLIEALDVLCAESDDRLCARYRLRGAAASISMSSQFRLARAALLLLGDVGLRREEAARASRKDLQPAKETPDVWQLEILGKRRKWRTTFLSARAVDALAAHWVDRGLDFSFGMQDVPLLGPLVVPETPAALDKLSQQPGHGFTPDGIYKMVTAVLKRISRDDTLALDENERAILRKKAPHAFRHTFFSTAVQSVPLDVLRSAGGHANIQTTSIYIQAENERAAKELGLFFKRKEG